MSINVTFKEFEETVFGFAKALAVNENKGDISKQVFERSRELAVEWYQEADLRRAFYIRENLTAEDWVGINKHSDYFEDDFKKGVIYWVIAKDHEEPIEAVFASIENRLQPYFSTLDNPNRLFEIDAYLSESTGNQLTSATPPRHPNPKKEQEEKPKQKKNYATAGPRTF